MHQVLFLQIPSQEHFSAANLIQSLCSAHWTQQQQPGRSRAPAKVVIFTRTGADVAKLGVGDGEKNLMKLVAAGAAAATAATDGGGAAAAPGVHAEDICVLQLRGLSSSAGVKASLAAFLGSARAAAPAAAAMQCDDARPRERLVLLLADMTMVTPSQLNLARAELDHELESLPAAARPLTVALAHCPAEQMQLGFPYHAVPTGGWDFCFCDALGLDDAMTAGMREAAAAAAATAPAQGAQSVAAPGTGALAVTDPRRWAAVGFALVDRPSPMEARIEFAGVFEAALRKAISGVKTHHVGATKVWLADKRGVTATFQVYGLGVSADSRTAAAASLFLSRPYLRNVLLDNFVGVMTETLQRTVRGAAVALLSGRAVKGGMLAMVRESMNWLLEDYLRVTYVALARDYGLEALARIPAAVAAPSDGGDQVALQAYAERALGLLTALAPTEVKNVAGGGQVTVICTAPTAPALPLFFQTAAALQQLVADAIEEASSGRQEASQDAVEAAAAEMLRDDVELAQIAKCIEEHPLLFRRFLSDVLQQLLKFHSARPLELDVLIELAFLAIGLGGARGAARPSCVRVLLLPRSDASIASLSQALAVLTPLRPLLFNAKGAALGDSRERLAAACAAAQQSLGLGAAAASPGNLSCGAGVVGAATLFEFGRILTAAAIELCWQRFCALALAALAGGASAAQGSDADADVKGWVALLRPLLTPLGNLRAISALLPATVAARVCSMVVALRVLAHLPTSPASRVLAAVHTAIGRLCTDATYLDIRDSDAAKTVTVANRSPPPVTLDFALRLLAHTVGLLQSADADSASGSVGGVGEHWPRALEDVIRWGIGSGSAVGDLAWGDSRGDGGAGPEGGASTGMLLALLLGVGLPPDALGSETDSLRSIVAETPRRVRVDIMSGLLPLNAPVPRGAMGAIAQASHVTACLAARDAALTLVTPLLAPLVGTLGCTGGGGGAAAAAPNVLFVPPSFTKLKPLLERAKAEALAADVGRAAEAAATAAADAQALGLNAGAGRRAPPPAAAKAPVVAALAQAPAPPPALPSVVELPFRDAAGPTAAALLFDVLYEGVLRAQDSNMELYGSAPGLAGLFCETIRSSQAGGRSLARPALTVWSSVIMQRLLEVLGDALSSSDADARPGVFASQTSPLQVSQALARIFCVDFVELAPPFFLQCIRNKQGLEWLLSNEQRLEVGGLGVV